ncbi:hypothetical protein [Sphingomonas sp. PB4P5]|uniref:hypothetical protein n=1 Tax=Parasphingomonas puruogangriensis TaxID=3096155 RepID=UPI002FCA2AAC
MLLIVAACSTPDPTCASQKASGIAVVQRLITAAEAQDVMTFAKLTLKSKTFHDWQLPKVHEVDRRDEGCNVRDMDAISARIILVYWICSRKDYRYLTERTFLLESGRVIYMYDDWLREVSVRDEADGG